MPAITRLVDTAHLLIEVEGIHLEYPPRILAYARVINSSELLLWRMVEAAKEKDIFFFAGETVCISQKVFFQHTVNNAYRTYLAWNANNLCHVAYGNWTPEFKALHKASRAERKKWVNYTAVSDTNIDRPFTHRTVFTRNNKS